MKTSKKLLLALTTICISSMATSALAAHHEGAKGYALTNNGKTLAVMNSLADAGEIKTYALSSSISAIAYRPVTGDLLGFSNGAIYSIDLTSGELINNGATFAEDTTINSNAVVGFDFNNKIDAVRAVSTSGDNLVYFPVGFGDNGPKANTVKRFTELAYAEDDINAGAVPLIFANAYTNAINGKKASGTFQYALDASTNSLVSLANNAGTLKTVDKIKIDGESVDLITMGGFDIVSESEGEDDAFAILQLNGQSMAGLYSINLQTANATLIKKLDVGGISSFAVSRHK